MKQRQKATLVLAGYRAGIVEWSDMAASDSRVITVWNLNLLKDSLHLANGFVDVEVVRVIFDRSVDAEEWLEFLTSMPVGFRGDVLYIARSDQAFLSAVGRRDDRVMYRLEGDDIRFYLEVSGIMERDEIVVPHFQPRFVAAEAYAV